MDMPSLRKAQLSLGYGLPMLYVSRLQTSAAVRVQQGKLGAKDTYR